MCYKVEDAMEYRRWVEEIPFIPVPDGCQIAPIPPFAGAVARFRFRRSDGHIKSVYLDCYDRLGCCGSPYWEVYPHDGDVGRCAMEDVDALVKMLMED